MRDVRKARVVCVKAELHGFRRRCGELLNCDASASVPPEADYCLDFRSIRTKVRSPKTQ